MIHNARNEVCNEEGCGAINPCCSGVACSLRVIAEAQQPKKVPRIGYLSAVDAASDSARAEGIRLALRERGYIEGQNIAIEYRYAEGKPIGSLSLRPSWCV